MASGFQEAGGECSGRCGTITEPIRYGLRRLKGEADRLPSKMHSAVTYGRNKVNSFFLRAADNLREKVVKRICCIAVVSSSDISPLQT